MPAPLPQVDLLALHENWPARYPFLLESTAWPDATAGHGRYDVLFAFPGARLWSDGGRLCAEGMQPAGADFLSSLDMWLQREGLHAPDAAPFRGGWFLYLGYELTAEIEPSLSLPVPPGDLPTAFAVRCPAALVRDRNSGRLELHTEAEAADVLRAQVQADIAALARDEDAQDPAAAGVAEVQEEPPERFLQALHRIQDYIRAGDVFQVNLSRRWDVRLERPLSAGRLYRRLRRNNPAPFSGLLRWGDSALLSSSPERLVRSDGVRVETRPIAGTRPRLDRSRDGSDRELLLAHPKERAEHIMLIDLERNDLGRVCIPGSVQVDELMTLESYAHVHHIVSNVSGRLRPGTAPGDIIRAVFPGGTITGCPKIRCMQIIAELEAEGRGAYTGSMGYLDRSGRLDLNILIRSLVLRGRQASFRAGAGIVADSRPQRELEETRAKARGLLQLFGHDA